MNRMIRNIYLILLLTKSHFIFANEVQVNNLFESELLHYLLFDLIFIISVWLIFYLCKVVLTHAKQKVSKNFSTYSQYYSEPPSKNRKTPMA